MSAAADGGCEVGVSANDADHRCVTTGRRLLQGASEFPGVLPLGEGATYAGGSARAGVAPCSLGDDFAVPSCPTCDDLTSSQFLFARGEANLPSPRLTLSFLPHRLWSKVAARLGTRLTFLSYRWACPRLMNGLFPGPHVTSRAHAIVHRSGGGDQLWRYAGTGVIRVVLSSM